MAVNLQDNLVAIPRTDVTAVPLVLGGNTFGWTSDREESFGVLDAFRQAGGTLIDTADVYSAWAEGHGGGESEAILGEWMAARGNRDDVVIATKVGMLAPFDKQDRATVTAALDSSLSRLRTDRVDLYYAHQDDENVAIEEHAETYDALVRAGKIRYVGISNYSPERMRRWFEHAAAEDLTVPVAIQPQYNLVFRKDYEQGYRPVAEHFDAAVFPYFSLASGFLTGKYRSVADLAGTAREGFAQGYFSEQGLTVVAELVRVAEAHEAEPATVALAWLLAKGITAPIASARTVEQLPALLAARSLRLTAVDVAALDAASQPFA
ncbi:aldo/keto reductase [Georgenia ruanii]|uniref:Aldo/keto reductase n=1 Tax=Georgenia ruanii TaxID=348442 RepID=A0A7J9UV35_9MICO|nr:aldo/keto reductase [Georgenia ruanii]MPV88213.1 aldo/keto reductase [Georgenia ruanii]